MMEEHVGSCEVYENTCRCKKDEAAPHSHCCVLMLCLGIFCILLLARIIIVSQISVEMKKQEADLREQTERMKNLENQIEQLNRQRDNLNHTLEIILMYDKFPVNILCPNKKCQPCQAGWILFQEKCYWFYDEMSLKTWEESRQFCQNKLADLVVINNLQEQEFVSNNTWFYVDKWHGYWLGLRKINNIWIWVDGHNDTLGFWNKQYEFNDDYGLLLPEKPPAQSWRSGLLIFRNKFICERDTLINSD